MTRSRIVMGLVTALVLAGLMQAAPTVATKGRPGPPVDLVAAAEGLGLSCVRTESGLEDERQAGVAYIKCTGQIATFDGTMLDTVVSLPTDPGHRPLPTVLDLPGWAGSKVIAQAAKQPPVWAAGSRWNNVWWAHYGRYAVLSYTPRGFHASCGMADIDPGCDRGFSHIADSRFEGEDAKHMLGVLVDAGIADRNRLAATGGSYGGGMVWTLATSRPWRSPQGTRLRLAVALTFTTWTDLEDALVPNGRPSGEGPVGVIKQDLLSGFYVLGRSNGQGRYGNDPGDVGSWFDGAHAIWTKGEPYGADAEAVAAAWAHKSAIFNDDFFAAVAAGEVEPVPVLAVQGWPDTVFPASQHTQMYDRLKAARSDYPISLGFADIGHNGATNSVAQWDTLRVLTNEFLDAHLAGRPFDHGVWSLRVSCGQPVTGWTTAETFEELATANPTLPATSNATLRWSPTTVSALTTDPLTDPPVSGISQGFTGSDPFPCKGAAADPSATTWSWEAPAETMVGIPRVHASYELTGSEGMLVAKVWDVAPDGRRSLVTRGVYRLSTSGGDPPAGELEFGLFGNHWRFEPNHRVELELAPSDAPYLRPSNLPFELELRDVSLTLPTR